ncbi:interleukin-17 receptor E-like protein isoform X1 [Misgurnus anguillicaudatus]|uniref:interleukin-17 receptor E-like protein isoform X1 n=2 Tax=Misgurnus anguillicaudatus TaxID=75329 RepID=UPI003CCFBB14
MLRGGTLSVNSLLIFKYCSRQNLKSFKQLSKFVRGLSVHQHCPSMKCLRLYLLLIMTQTAYMNRIKKDRDCTWRCEGLRCKSKPYSLLSESHCRKQTVSNVFNNVKLSTVLGCEGRKCSLQLKIATSVNVTSDIRGVSLCADSAGMMGHCQIYNFDHDARKSFIGKQAGVQFKCIPVRPGQHVFVTLKTVPNYCKATKMQKYIVPECSHEDIRNEISECITGKLEYNIDKVKRKMTVMVKDAPEDTDYNLRLCHKRSVICAGDGTLKTIKAQDLQKSITFQYSKALPCLCIEGWPARVDARRVQACPFKNDLEELWSGIMYDFNKEELIWEPACPIKVSVTLCHSHGENNCRDLGNVIHSTGQKVTFTSVDPHPLLCTKFTTDAGSWIKCPFTKGNFSVWRTNMKSKYGNHWAEITSWVNANFSVSPCEMKPSSQCKSMEGNATKILFVDKTKRTTFNLSRTACEICVCIQVKRVDVQYSVPVLQCDVQCSNRCPERRYYREIEKIIVPAAVFITVLLAAAFIAKMSIKDGSWRRMLWTKLGERDSDTCLYSK